MLPELLVYDAAEATEDEVAFRALENACIDLYLAHDDCRPARVILQVFREDDREAILARWVTRAIDTLDRCPTHDDSEQTRRSLCLADGIFDLVGLVQFTDQDQANKVVASLGKVWTRHAEWRRCAGKAARAFEMQGWVDPATTAGESFHQLSPRPKTDHEIKIQVEQVVRLGSEYPDPLRDHYMYCVLCHLGDRWTDRNGTLRIDEALWLDAIGFVFAQVVKEWVNGHWFLLEYTCQYLRERAEGEWEVLAQRMFSHARDVLRREEREQLMALFGLQRETPLPPRVGDLLRTMGDRQPFSVSVQDGIWGHPADGTRKTG